MKLAEEMMRWEVGELVGVRNQAQKDRSFQRWGTQPGYCVVDGQKISLERPRVRDTRQQEVPLGSYGLLQRASLMHSTQKRPSSMSRRMPAPIEREFQEENVAWKVMPRPWGSVAFLDLDLGDISRIYRAS